MRDHSIQMHKDLIQVFDPLGKADPASWSSVCLGVSRSLQNLSSIIPLDSAAVAIGVGGKYEIIATSDISSESAQSLIERIKGLPQKECKRPDGKLQNMSIWTDKLENKKQIVLLENVDQPGGAIALFILSRPFEKDLDLLQAFVSHIAKTIEISRYVREQNEARKLLEQANADLKAMQDSLLNIMDDLQTRNKYLSRLNSISVEMARSPDLEGLLSIVAGTIGEILDVPQVAIFTIDESQSKLVLKHSIHDQDLSHDQTKIDIDEIQPDFPVSIEKLDAEGNQLHRALAQSVGAKSGLVVPLVSKRGPLGLIVVAENRWHRVFSEDEKDNIASISSMLSVCMDNLALMQSLTQHVEQISNLNEYISTVVDSVDIAIMVVNMDFKITMFNKGFQKLYGYNPKDFIGKNVFEAFPHLLEQGFGEVVQIIKSGKTFVRENWRRKLRDGREVVQNVRIVPHRNASGEIIGAVALLTDITEKVQLEDQLDKSEAKFRKLVEELDDAYLVLCDGTIAYANNAATSITGLQVHQLIGSKPQRILIDKELVSLLEGCPTKKMRCESKVLHTSGIVVPVEASICPSDYGEKKAVSVVLRDITERKKIENQLAEKNREMRLRNEQITRLNEELEATVNRLKESQQSLLQSERIAAITETAIAMNHEINGPLFAILGQAQLLLRKCGDKDQDLIRRLKVIEESALKIACATKKLANMADPVIQCEQDTEPEEITSVNDK